MHPITKALNMYKQGWRVDDQYYFSSRRFYVINSQMGQRIETVVSERVYKLLRGMENVSNKRSS